MTGRTITDPDELKSELARVRSAGYAASNEENEDGARAVDIPSLGATVRKYAGRMSHKLGYGHQD